MADEGDGLPVVWISPGVATIFVRATGVPDFVATAADVAGTEWFVVRFCFHKTASIVGFSGMPAEDSTRYLTLILRPTGGFAQ